MIAPARRAAQAVLLAVAQGHQHLDDAMAEARTSLPDPRDRALLHELATGTLRWQGLLDFHLTALSRVPLPRLDPEVLTALRLGAYQLLYLTRVPASAVVHDAVALVRAARRSSATGLTNAVLRRLGRGERRPVPDRPASDASLEAWAAYLAVVHAHPEWLVARWVARDGVEAAEARLRFDNLEPPATLRINPLRAPTPAALRQALADDGLETRPCAYAAEGLLVTGGSPWRSAAVAAGVCVLQDEGSQLIGAAAPVRAGDRVLDVCAAPGGKALQYAARAGAAGFVVACDVRSRRLDYLAEMLRRGGASRAGVVRIAEHDALPLLPVFDVVIVDAPCTGLGTLRRDPDIKWRRRPDDLVRYAALQRDLLARAAAVVRPGGSLVYSTCSTEPDENEAVVETFLAGAPGYRPAPLPPTFAPFADADGWLRLRPERHGLEGYFAAVLTGPAGT